LPAAVLAAGSAAAMIRVVRAGVLAALGQGFARAARARGIGPRMLLVHALRHALLPVINLAGLSLPALLSGTLVAEVVFAWPGMGRLTYDAIRARDIPVALATTVLATFLVVAGSLVADLAMAAADPRIRLRGHAERP
jgi:peptide/nickel transport system permease protein